MRLVTISLVFLSLGLASISATAQSTCPQLPKLERSQRANIFSEQQEVELGEIVAQPMAQSLRIIEDPELVDPLRRIGERIVRQMPPSGLKFRFYLVDDPDANAFALPGGRVYVTRKLIASTKTEDELAGVVAHEMGHQLNHDSAVTITKYFKVLINVTSVGDREDIENKYHHLLDSYRKHEARIEVDMDKAQLGADELAVFATARAGYDPKGVVEFWDRFTERKGRKGGWLSDVFSSPAPETKRLREFAHVASGLPRSCVEAVQPTSQADYDKWKNALLHFSGFGKQESVPGLATKKPLDPPLRGELKHFRFSPDGRLLLAQDDTNVFVLQREPLQFLFRIDAPNSEPAHFTPDSQFVVFNNEALRVYKWSVAEKREVNVNDVYVFRGCLRTLLSPDGSVLACFKPDADEFLPIGIRLIDVATDQVIFDKKNFLDASVNDGRGWAVYKYLILKGGPAFTMDFSSDGRYFLAGISHFTFGYDLKEKQELKLPGSLKTIMETAFAFMGPDRVLGVDGDQGYDSKIVRIPSGEVIQSGLHIGPLAIQAPSAGEFAIVRPLIETPAGLMDLKLNKIFLASKTDALDVYDGTWVSERSTGEVALYRRPQTTPIAATTLPRAPLGSTLATVFSPDLSMLAVSDRSRGRIWDLSGTGTWGLAAFRGTWLERNGALIDFAAPNRFRKLRTKGVSEKELVKEENDKQGDTIATIDLVKPAMAEVVKYQKRQRVDSVGSTYLVLSAKDADEHPGRDVTMEVHDFRTGQMLWSRQFKRMPEYGWNPTENILILAWDLSTRAAKDEIKQDPEAARLVSAIDDKEQSYFIAALDARTGNPIARFPIDTGKGSFRIKDMNPSGNYLVFADTNDRLLIYNLQAKRIGQFFGKAPAVSAKAGLLAAEREPGRITIYDLSNMAQRQELTFNCPILYAQFSADGRRLGILTEKQDVYIVDVPTPPSAIAK